jgi:tRNA threonylcarbamoyladenosine biosynthesis protein TsaB
VSATTRYDHTAVLTLALDTTTRAGSVAVVRDATLLALVHGDAARTHGERLPAEIDRALQQAGVGVADLELLAVASGPGAFTGLRIGLAAIQGMAMVLNVPVIAVSALDALALAAFTFLTGTVPLTGGQSPARDPRPQSRPPSPIAAWMDAARGEVFAAFYDFPHHTGVDLATPVPTSTPVPTPTSVPTVGAPDVVLAALPRERDIVFVGDGATRYSTQILQHGGARHRVVAAPATIAQFIAHIGVARAARGEAGPPHALQPLYVRRSDAELERDRREVP